MEVVRSILAASFVCASLGYEIHYAVNFGSGGGFNDSQGIVYEKEASSYTKSMTSTKISGTNDHDQKLYQSYSQSGSSLLYYISDVKEPGQYLLVFKQFADASRAFNMILNGVHQAVTKLTVYNEVGTYTAYDEYVYFSVCNDQLLYKNQKSAIMNNKISVEFKMVSGSYVYMSAMLLVRGDVENFPIPSSLLFRQSTDAALSQLFQQSVHSCGKKSKDVEIVLAKEKEKEKAQKIIAEPPPSLEHRSGLSLSMNNFTFGNINIFPAQGHANELD
jgi:Malectin domain